MSGFVGKNSIRRSSKMGHSKRWCATISSWHGHRGHLESFYDASLQGHVVISINQKMNICSSRLRVLMWSFGFGVAICINMDHPVYFCAHSFI